MCIVKKNYRKTILDNTNIHLPEFKELSIADIKDTKFRCLREINFSFSGDTFSDRVYLVLEPVFEFKENNMTTVYPVEENGPYFFHHVYTNSVRFKFFKNDFFNKKKEINRKKLDKKINFIACIQKEV